MPPSRNANHSEAISSSQSNRLGRVRWTALGLFVFVGLAVRIFCLACKPFWFDEAFSVEVARVSLGNFLHLLWWREANMSLYYVLLRMWLHFGQGPYFIRSLSAVIATAAIPAVYWLASLLYDRRVALIAAAMLTFNAYSVRYAQEARSYSLFLLLAILSSVFFVRCLRSPSRRNRAAYVLFSILAVYAHLYALLLLVGQWLASRWMAQPRSPQLRKNWKIIGFAVAPLLIFVAKTGAGPIRWISRPGLRDLAEFFKHFAGSDRWPLLTVCAAAILVAIVPLRNRLWSRNSPWEVWRYQFLLTWLLFPIGLTVMLSFARPVFLPRYMIFCLPAFVILAAAGLSTLRSAWMLAVATAIILLLEVQGTAFIYTHDFDQERDASVAAAEFILDHASPGDAAVFHIAETRIPYEFVRTLRSGENTASPEFSTQFGPEIVFPSHGAGLDYKDFTGKPTAELLKNMLPSHPRVWVMLMNNGTAEKPDPTTVMLTQVLPEILPHVQRWQFRKVEVRLYEQ
jgi:mannosyltransferase